MGRDRMSEFHECVESKLNIMTAKGGQKFERIVLITHCINLIIKKYRYGFWRDPEI